MDQGIKALWGPERKNISLIETEWTGQEGDATGSIQEEIGIALVRNAVERIKSQACLNENLCYDLCGLGQHA